MKLHYDVHAGQGPYLLLVHGILAGRSLWNGNLAALCGVSRPVVVELWGHGRSPSPEDPALYAPDAYVRAFEEIRRELGAERWIVCGQSFGAALTLRYALDHPERTIAQIFTNSVSALADEEWAEQRRRTSPALAEAIEQGGRAALEHMPVHPIHARRLAPEARDWLLEDAALLDPAGVAKTFRYGVPESSVRQRIGENRVPALLVCGEREKRFTPHREYAAQCMPLVEVVGVDAGHAVNLEGAAEFNRAAVDFIRRAAG